MDNYGECSLAGCISSQPNVSLSTAPVEYSPVKATVELPSELLSGLSAAADHTVKQFHAAFPGQTIYEIRDRDQPQIEKTATSSEIEKAYRRDVDGKEISQQKEFMMSGCVSSQSNGSSFTSSLPVGPAGVVQVHMNIMR
jgi:hypothetical protein